MCRELQNPDFRPVYRVDALAGTVTGLAEAGLSERERILTATGLRMTSAEADSKGYRK